MNTLILTKIFCIKISEQTEEEHCRILKENEEFIKKIIFLGTALVETLFEKKIIESQECNDVKYRLRHSGEDAAVSVLFAVNRFIFSTKYH